MTLLVNAVMAPSVNLETVVPEQSLGFGECSGAPATHENSDSTGRSSDTESDNKYGSREKVLQKSSKYRVREYLERAMESGKSGSSFLESSAVRDKPARYYANERQEMESHFQKHAAPLATDGEVDGSIVQYFDLLLGPPGFEMRTDAGDIHPPTPRLQSMGQL